MNTNWFRHAVFALLCAAPGASAETLLGVYYGNQGWKMEQVRALEAWQNKKHAVVNLFTDWTPTTKVINNLFSQQLPNIWNNGNVPMISWEPFTGGTTPLDIEVRIGSGAYDGYINNWATRLETFLRGPDGKFNTADDRRIYIRLAHEMNGNWYPWGAASGANTPEDFVAMWRHVVGIFDSKGLDATHVQWVWAVNHEDVGGFAAEAFYPGDDWVDWVAIDGYNWGSSQSWSSWKTPAQIFDAMHMRIGVLTTNRPLALTEFASSTSSFGSVSIAAKSQWTMDAMNYAAANGIRMVCWFNEDKETDWAIFGGSRGDGQFKFGRTTYKTYSSYRSAVAAVGFVTTSATNPRLLTDAQFAGQ